MAVAEWSLIGERRRAGGRMGLQAKQIQEEEGVMYREAGRGKVVGILEVYVGQPSSQVECPMLLTYGAKPGGGPPGCNVGGGMPIPGGGNPGKGGGIPFGGKPGIPGGGIGLLPGC